MNKMKINQMRTFKKHNSNYTQKIHTAEIRKICWRNRKLFFAVSHRLYKMYVDYLSIYVYEYISLWQSLVFSAHNIKLRI